MSVKITPKMPRVEKSKSYANMKNRDFFIKENRLYIKCDLGDQNAVCVQDGNFEDELGNFHLIPVDVEIKWTKRLTKKK